MQARDSIVFVVPLTCLQHWQRSEQYGTTCAERFRRPSSVVPLGPQSPDAGPDPLLRDSMASDQFRAKILRLRIRRPRSIFNVSFGWMRFLGALDNPPKSRPRMRRFHLRYVDLDGVQKFQGSHVGMHLCPTSGTHFDLRPMHPCTSMHRRRCPRCRAFHRASARPLFLMLQNHPRIAAISGSQNCGSAGVFLDPDQSIHCNRRSPADLRFPTLVALRIAPQQEWETIIRGH